VLVFVWLVIWGIKLLVELVTASRGLVNPWSRRNRSRRMQLAIEQGQMDLAEGRWASAQKHLTRAAEAERQPLLFYLGARACGQRAGPLRRKRQPA
jgi:HemY protein